MDERSSGQPDPLLLLGLEPLADVERALRSAAVGRDRPTVGAHDAIGGLEDDQVLADRNRRDPELVRQVTDPGPSVLLDDSDDVILSFPGEDIARGGAWRNRHASPLGANLRPESRFRLVAEAQ